MGKEHELGIRFTSDGAADVSKDIEKIADGVAALDDEVSIDVTADTRKAETNIQRFEREVADVTDDARELRFEFKSQTINREIKKILRDLEKLEDPVDIEARTEDLERAQKDLRDLSELAERKYEIDIDADPRRTAKRAAGDVEGLNTAAQRGIGVTRGLTDELGETARAGGVAGNAIIDAGEAVEIFGAKAGISEATLGKVAGALGGIGLAVTAGSVAWGYLSQSQKNAAKDAEELRKVQEQLADSKYEDAAESLYEKYTTEFDRLGEAGFEAATIVQYLTGSVDELTDASGNTPDWGNLSGQTVEVQQLYLAFDKLAKVRDDFDENARAMVRQEEAVNGLAAAFEDEMAPTTEVVAAALEDVRTELEDGERATLDFTTRWQALKDELSFEGRIARIEQDIGGFFAKLQSGAELSKLDIIGLKEDVIALAEETGKDSGWVIDMNAQIDSGSLDVVEAELNRVSGEYTATIKVVPVYLGNINWDGVGQVPLSLPDDSPTGFGLDDPVTATAAAGGPSRTRRVGAAVGTVQNITVNVPNSLNLRNVSDTLTRWTRINGGRL